MPLEPTLHALLDSGQMDKLAIPYTRYSALKANSIKKSSETLSFIIHSNE
ncbi:Putative protein in type-1 retrotransposable element R1DM, partial [Araneus ventricosus]